MQAEKTAKIDQSEQKNDNVIGVEPKPSSAINFQTIPLASLAHARNRKTVPSVNWRKYTKICTLNRRGFAALVSYMDSSHEWIRRCERGSEPKENQDDLICNKNQQEVLFHLFSDSKLP